LSTIPFGNQRQTQLLITGRWIFTGTESTDTILDEGAVLVEAGYIKDIGSIRALRPRYPHARQMGSNDVAVLPGMINAHHHANGVSAVQHGIQDDLLESWLLSLATKRLSNPYLETLLSASRLMRTGVTAVVDMVSGLGSAHQFEARTRHVLEAYDKAGIRARVAPGFRDQSLIVAGPGEDRRFLESLSDEERIVALDCLPGRDSIDETEYFAMIERLWNDYREHPRLGVWFGPPAPHWVSDRFLERIAQYAEAMDVGIQTHVNESVYEMLHGPRYYGQPTVHHLERLGLLSPRLSIAHGVWLNDAEIDLLAENGACVSHNPGSNLRLRSGIAPLSAMIERGVTVGLGMDSTTLDDEEDMFSELRLALRLSQSSTFDGPTTSLYDLWRMATHGGAVLMGCGGEIGRITPGHAADLVLVELDRITWPWVAPEVDPLMLTLMRAKAGDVRTVLVGGEVVLEDGQPCTFDLREVGEALAATLDEMEYNSDAAYRARLLRPLIEKWYGDWEMPDLIPWSIRNAR
jgi:cytosine/adenosine deaminase-related metal-dependent hydrolase